MRRRARRFNLAHDGRHVGGEGVRLGALGDGALGPGLGKVARVAQIHSLGHAGRQGDAPRADLPNF